MNRRCVVYRWPCDWRLTPVLRTVMHDWRATVATNMRALHLTRRETEIAWEVLGGHSNAEVAQALYINENTVKNHMTNILRVTGSESRSQLLLVLLGFARPTRGEWDRARLRDAPRALP